MAAIPSQHLAVRDSAIYRRNWASQEPGVITVFCIVGAVAIGLTYLFVSRWFSRRRIAKQEAAAKL